MTFALQLEVEDLGEGGEEGEEEVVVLVLPRATARHVQPHAWKKKREKCELPSPDKVLQKSP